jgi:hypothetical protein
VIFVVFIHSLWKAGEVYDDCDFISSCDDDNNDIGCLPEVEFTGEIRSNEFGSENCAAQLEKI